MATGRTFDTKQAAEYLGCHQATIRRAVEAGRLTATRDMLARGQGFRYTKEELDRFRAAAVLPVGGSAGFTS